MQTAGALELGAVRFHRGKETEELSHLLENSLLEPPISCDGEPAPERGLLVMMPAEDTDTPLGRPKGDLLTPAPGVSTGELLTEGDVERGWLGKPRGKFSDLEVDIINYLAPPHETGSFYRLDL